jgi:hypothetical protein
MTNTRSSHNVIHSTISPRFFEINQRFHLDLASKKVSLDEPWNLLEAMPSLLVSRNAEDSV